MPAHDPQPLGGQAQKLVGRGTGVRLEFIFSADLLHHETAEFLVGVQIAVERCRGSSDLGSYGPD